MAYSATLPTLQLTAQIQTCVLNMWQAGKGERMGIFQSCAFLATGGAGAGLALLSNRAAMDKTYPNQFPALTRGRLAEQSAHLLSKAVCMLLCGGTLRAEPRRCDLGLTRDKRGEYYICRNV